MSLISSLLFAVALQSPPMRLVEVKSAGVSLEIPKAWKLNQKAANIAISARVPLEGSKVVGTLEISYVINDSKDGEGYSAAQKELLTNGGSKVERQWTVDVLGSPFLFTKSSKENITRSRGVFFRPTESKLVVSLSAPSDQFEKFEPTLTSILGTLKDIPVVTANRPSNKEERKIAVTQVFPGDIVPTPVREPVTLFDKKYVLRLPKGSKVSKLTDSSFTIAVPNLNQSVILDCLDQRSTPINQAFSERPAASGKLFKGAVNRIDRLVPIRKDRQQRQFVWRWGTSAATGKALMTCDVLVAQLNVQYLFLSYSQNDQAFFSQDEKNFTQFVNSIGLDEAK